MKTELLAAISLAGVFGLKGIGNSFEAPSLTAAEKQQIAVHATCAELNKKFMGDKDVYAKERVHACKLAINTLNAIMK